MDYRAVKDAGGVIIAIGYDESQSGNYPDGSSDEERSGVWCSWTFSSIPEFSAVEASDNFALRFKENDAEDGIELRSDEAVLDNPQG